jgi:hypothetical protein
MSFIDQMEAEWKAIEDRDAIAKMNNTLIGRYIKYPYADGHAFYEIWAVADSIAHVSHIPWGDGWSFPMIEDMEGKVPVAVAFKNIKQRDQLEEMFKKL